MVNLIPVGEEPTGTATEDDVVEGETFSSANVEGEATGTIPDRGSLSISSPGSDEPAGYYPNGISNNITDRGSIGDLEAGDFSSSGYYSSGTIPEPEPELTSVNEIEHLASDGRKAIGSFHAYFLVNDTSTGPTYAEYYVSDSQSEVQIAAASVDANSTASGDMTVGATYETVEVDQRPGGQGGNITDITVEALKYNQ